MNPEATKRAARAADAEPCGPEAAPPSLALGPTWRLYLEYWRMVRRHVPERRERLRCYACLIGWLMVNRNAGRLLLEPTAGLDLRFGVRAREIRQRVLVAARGAHGGQLRLRQR